MLKNLPGRSFVVRDPVHGYLAIAPHERLVIDSPITQRLRRIGQTGLAELVFPEAKTSRFVHSLGAMHLASRFLIASLENASTEDVKSFFDDVRSRINWTTLRMEEVDELLRHTGTLDAFASIRSASFIDPTSDRGRDDRRLLALIEGALRLAALFHDLGHLPFSHDTEYALQEFASEREAVSKPLPSSTKAIANAKAPHEEIGHELAHLVFSLLSESNTAVRHVYALAKDILDAPEPDYTLTTHQPASGLQWLHSLVDGEIDVDRADYLLRDGQALGLDFAQYDLDRLVANLVLISTPNRGFTTVIREPGLAALESFCLTRSRSNQVFVRHHKVAQVGSALRYASKELMNNDRLATPLLEFLARLKELHNASDETRRNVLAQYAVLDDTWAFQALRALQKSTNEPLLSACLGVTLDRARSLRSIWKRKGDLTADQFKRLRSLFEEFLSPKTGTLRLQQARRRLLDHKVLLTVLRFRPYAETRKTRRKAESVMLIRSSDLQLRPASTISPLIRHLKDLWNEDIPIYAFAEVENLITTDEVLSLMDADQPNSSKE